MIKRILDMDFLKTFKTELINVGIFMLLSTGTVTDYISKGVKLVYKDYDTGKDEAHYMLYTKAAILLGASLVLNKVMVS